MTEKEKMLAGKLYDANKVTKSYKTNINKNSKLWG